MKSKILITGASGYIGSCLYFYLKKNFKIFGLDKKTTKILPIKKCNLLNSKKLNSLLKKEKPDLIVHFAAQSLVDETINKKKYFQNNVLATQNLILGMKKNNLDNIIFSSTAALYEYKNETISEKSKLKPLSTYAKTKYRCEKIIKKSKLNAIILRFFNVCSSFKTNKKIIGELHNPETHLIPTLVYKNLKKMNIYIYGNDYKTKDGSCIRDYVHIKDICSAVKKSLVYLKENKNKHEIINIASSTQITNLEILRKIEKITKIVSKYKIVKRRSGDVAKLTCSIQKAKKKLKWKPKFSNVNTIINDEISWIKYLDRLKIKRKFKNYL